MIYLKDTSDIAYTLNGHAVFRNDVESYGYHIPDTAVNFAKSLGLKLQEMTISGYLITRNDIPFHKINKISFDNWATYQTVYFSRGPDFPTVTDGFYIPFEMICIASPLRLGTSHASGTKWGLTSTSLANSGNYTAYAKLVYQAPKFYFPLTQNLIDFAGSSIAFTNANSKTYKGVSYPANTPIFDSGLYLSNEFSDVAKLTFANLSAHSIIAQIKSTRYPSDWIVGGSGGNLLSANQSNAETDTTGMGGIGGTLSRTTVAGEFYAGTAGFKLVSTGSNDIYIYTSTKITGLTENKYYCFSVYAKASTSAKNWTLKIKWFTAADVEISVVETTAVAASTSFTRLLIVAKAPATAAKCQVWVRLISAVTSDVLYADNLMLEQINETNVKIWDDGSKNKLYIDIPNNLLKWTDYTSTISCTFPTDYFLQENSSYTRKTITIVAIHNGATKELHCKYEGGSFNDGSGSLNNLVWTNEITLGRFDGSLFNLIQYPYVLTASEYGNLNFSLAPLRFNDFYIANITKGNITYEEGSLKDENNNEISGLCSGIPVIEGTIECKEGLSARWTAEIKDTYFP